MIDHQHTTCCGHCFPNNKNSVPLPAQAPGGTYTVTVYAADTNNHGSNAPNNANHQDGRGSSSYES